MDLVLELLDWAKDKDVGEIHYEDRSGAAAVVIQLNFAAGKPNAASPVSRYSYLQSPGIGKLSLSLDKVKVGQMLAAGDVLGFVEGHSEKSEIKTSTGGKVAEVLAQSGASAGYGQPLVLLEI